ncbi:MAG: aspartate aminotransferase family protein, partial [Chloroflexota bacterium]
RGYQAIVEQCCANAAAFAAWVAARPGMELLGPARLNIVCFRFAPPGLSAERTDALNRDAVAAVRADGRAFVSGTVWQGKVALRAAFDNWATSARDVALLQEVVADVWAV